MALQSGAGAGPVVITGPNHDEDLLVNLDAFDMLTDFSDLECHDALDALIPLHGDLVAQQVAFLLL